MLPEQAEKRLTPLDLFVEQAILPSLSADFNSDSEGQARLAVLQESLAHGRRVASLLDYYLDRYLEDVALLTGLSGNRDYYRLGGYLHDVGKAFVQDPGVWSKRKEELTPEDQNEMKNHALKAPKLFSLLNERLAKSRHAELNELITNMASLHHEYLDGSGYQGLKGEEIPFYIRLLTAIDHFVAMLEDRSYRDDHEKYTPTLALHEMVSRRSKFDPAILSNLFDLFQTDDYLKEPSLSWIGKVVKKF